MRVLVINNLVSGYREGAVYDFIRSLAQDGDEVVLRSTDGTTDIASLAADATSFDAVVASGGDGTVTTVAFALAGTDVPLLVFPAGTANLLALNLELPTEPHALAKLLREGTALDFDLARLTCAEGVYGFGIMAGAGYDASIMKDAEPAKRLLGPAAYFQAAVANLKPQRSHFTLDLDGTVVEADGICVLVANFASIQFDITVVPENKPRDGMLDVAVMKANDPIGLLPFIGATLSGRAKQAVDEGSVVSAYRARHIRVDAEPPMPIQFDGEVANATTPFEIDVLPGSVRMIVSAEGLKKYADR